MLAKLTAENQLTLPQSITQAIGAAEYFEVKVEGGQIILTPVKIQGADSVRAKLGALNVNEQDITDAVEWVRQSRSSIGHANYLVTGDGDLLCLSDNFSCPILTVDEFLTVILTG